MQLCTIVASHLAIAADDDRLATFYRDALVREEMTTVIDQWTADVQAGRTPVPLLDDQEYLDGLLAPYDEATARAEAASVDSREASETADSYVLATVLLAVSLFFAGVTSSFRVRIVRVVLLASSGFALAFAASRIADLGVI